MNGVVATSSWVVVPPFRHDAAWRHAIVEAAHAVGRQVHDFDSAPDAAPLHDSRVVMLTTDASQPVRAGVPAEAIAGLIGPGLRLESGDDTDALPQNIRAYTDLVGRMALLRPDRIFRCQDFVTGAVEIIKGITLSAPRILGDPRLSPRLQAVDDAVQLLDPAVSHAIWAPELLNYNSRRISGGTSGELDLTGRSRCLIAGPYIVLPVGRWRATYRLTFDRTGSRSRFRVDWGGVHDFSSEEFVPGRAGIFEISQDYVWHDPGPAEIRVILLEGVFDGQMSFSGAEVSRIE